MIDVMTIEQSDDQEAVEIALQKAINTGTAWSLQGSYGRSMMQAIERGRCMLGRKPASDYYGNRIPSRSEVLAGTKGSREYVEERSGVAWADKVGRL